MAQCRAKIRPFPDETEIQCIEDDSQPHSNHAGIVSDYAYPGSKSKLNWNDRDRRTFRGDWTSCDQSTCILPAGHWGDHA